MITQVRLTKEVEEFLKNHNILIDRDGDQYISFEGYYVKRAGNNDPGVYEYYPSKEDLIIEQKKR